MDLSLFVNFAKFIVFGSSGILATDLARCKAYMWIYLGKSKFTDPMGSNFFYILKTFYKNIAGHVLFTFSYLKNEKWFCNMVLDGPAEKKG